MTARALLADTEMKEERALRLVTLYGWSLIFSYWRNPGSTGVLLILHGFMSYFVF